MLLRILRYSVKVIYNKSDYILAQSHKIKRLLKKKTKTLFCFIIHQIFINLKVINLIK